MVSIVHQFQEALAKGLYQQLHSQNLPRNFLAFQFNRLGTGENIQQIRIIYLQLRGLFSTVQGNGLTLKTYCNLCILYSFQRPDRITFEFPSDIQLRVQTSQCKNLQEEQTCMPTMYAGHAIQIPFTYFSSLPRNDNMLSYLHDQRFSHCCSTCRGTHLYP